MKKRIVSVLLCCVLTAAVTGGCGSDKKAEAAENPAGEDGLATEDVTLKVWESSGVAQEFIEQAGAAIYRRTSQHNHRI